MAVTVYRSTDTSAPVLSGSAGALVNVLDKCLVAGYGSKAAAGWSKPYTGTNTAVFRMGGGNQFYLDVNDNSPGGGLAKEARLFGYEAMTAVATGSGQFPTTTQLAAGIIGRKSTSADATARAWVLVADDRTVHFFPLTGDTAGTYVGAFMFGDFYSYLSSTDNYRTAIIGRHTENSVTTTFDNLDLLVVSFAGTLHNGSFIARTYTGLGSSLQTLKYGDCAKAGVQSASSMQGQIAIPNPVDGNIWLSPVYLGEKTALFTRGHLRGLFHWMHVTTGWSDGDTVSGAGPYAGHTFLLLKNSGNSGVYCLDVTGPWDTN